MVMAGGSFAFPGILGPAMALIHDDCSEMDPAFCEPMDTPMAGEAISAGSTALRAAMRMIGIPYSWGGGGVRGPGYGVGHGASTRGFDCSGLTQYAWASAGVKIGRTTQEQWRSGRRIPKDRLRPGDLVFYDSKPGRRGPEHVGLAVDATQMVNAPFTGASVRLDPLDRPTFLGVVRPRAGRADVGLLGRWGHGPAL